MPESWTAGVGSRITDTRRIKWGKILLRYGGTLQPTDTIRIIMAKIAGQITAGPVVVVPGAPVAGAASDVADDGFTANWGVVSGATAYRLDVSTSNVFASFVSGYQDRPVGNVTSYGVSGLSDSTTYYFRVRATNSAGTSGNSNVVSATTLAGYDPETLDWVARVIANGGSVSQATKDAANNFIVALNAGGLRSLIYRLNLFAGDQFAAAQTPFIKDKGSALDMPFILNLGVAGSAAAWTYTETGAIGGLKSSTVNSFLATGFTPQTHFDSIDDCGFSVYIRDALNELSVEIGGLTFNTPNIGYLSAPANDGSSHASLWTNDIASGADAVKVGLYTAVRTAANLATLYRGATSIASSATPGGSLVSGTDLHVFSLALSAGNDVQFCTKTLGGYAIHKGMSGPQVTSFNTAWQAFQTALGRQV